MVCIYGCNMCAFKRKYISVSENSAYVIYRICVAFRAESEKIDVTTHSTPTSYKYGSLIRRRSHFD